MPCGKETVVHYEDPVQAAKDLIPGMYSKRWFGFAEVDIEVSPGSVGRVRRVPTHLHEPKRW